MESSRALRSRIGVTALLISGLSTGLLAHAADKTTKVHAGVATHSVIVSFDELNPNSDAGVRAIYAKIRAAATRVCGHYEARDLRNAQDWKRCYVQALNDAVAQTGNVRVATLRQSVGKSATLTSPVAAQD